MDFVFEGLEADTEEWDKTYKVEMVIQPLGLDVNDRLNTLSGGQLRRAALARALVEEPDAISRCVSGSRRPAYSGSSPNRSMASFRASGM